MLGGRNNIKREHVVDNLKLEKYKLSTFLRNKAKIVVKHKTSSVISRSWQA